MAEPDRAQMTI